MVEVLKRVYENIGKAGSLSSPTALSKVTGVHTKSVQDYLQNEPSYTLHRNHRFRANHYRKSKAFSHCI
jgi:Tfp pilus assembly pilus retraction ATPase PilT